jgi:hypothetical protein
MNRWVPEAHNISACPRIESDDLAAVQRLQEVVGRHLKQVASGETFEVEWRTAQ